MTYDKNNIFAKILRGEIPCKKIYEDDFVLAFEDIAPAAPVHALVIPKGEYVSFDDFAANAPKELVHGFFAATQKVARELKLPLGGYRIISNHGADAGQLVPHFHIHILGGQNLGKLLG
jgi:diadenosine tetraphosphate (Ap4A) HIT family hydrolase